MISADQNCPCLFKPGYRYRSTFLRDSECTLLFSYFAKSFHFYCHHHFDATGFNAREKGFHFSVRFLEMIVVYTSLHKKALS